jgi:hypothetical protein
VTFIITIAIHFIICEFFTYRSLLLSALIGYFLFVIIGKICSLNGFEHVGRLFTARIYFLIILFAGAYAGAYATGKGDVVERYIPELWKITLLPALSQPQDEKPIKIDEPDFSSSGDYVYE